MPEPATTRAAAYFAKFTGDDAASILQSLPASNPRTFEDEQLDFKSGTPKLDTLDAIWSKALGAFANNEGGVVVWGIEARKDKETGIDAASSIALVPNVDYLKQKLFERFQFLTDPPLVGTQITSVPVKADSPEGFVVCFIPEGTQKPYRSLYAPQRYYVRINDDSVEMPHGILRQLFYPKYSTRVQVTVGFGDFATSNFEFLRFHFRFKNVGESSVNAPFVNLSAWQAPLYDVPPPDGFNLVELRRAMPLDPVIHPEMESDLFAFVKTNRLINEYPPQSGFAIRLYQANEQVKIARFIFDFSRKEFWDEVEVLPNPLVLQLRDEKPGSS